VVARADESPALRGQAAGMLGRIDQPSARSALVQMLETSAGNLQREAAGALAQSPDGVKALLGSIAAGKASARLLKQPAIASGVKHLGGEEAENQSAQLTRKLPPAGVEIDQKIAEQIKNYAIAEINPERGHAIFIRTCSICHRVGEEGKLVGPQLDGIGQRGVERVLEDILDPNRNVDAAYRLSVYTLNDGKVVSGRELRREGEVIVVVDFTGNEVRLSENEIKTHEQTGLSLMSDALGASLSDEELRDLLGWLLEK
jgi:putative heme-binding domain-containing protein